METLHLNLKKKWFDMILSGEKKEEYREVTDYWKPRMQSVKNWGIDNITFSNGYSKDRRQFVIELRYITIRRGGVTDWGAVKGVKYFTLHLGKLIKNA